MNDQCVQRVRELTGKLVDEDIEDDEWRELRRLVTASDDGRRAYIDAMLLQAYLHCWGYEAGREVQPCE